MPYLLVAIGVMGLLITHPMNVAPIGAIGLFAGAYCSPRIAWLVPLAAMLLTSLLGGFYDLTVMCFVYLGFLGGPLFGRLLLAERRSPLRFVGGTLLGGCFFYLVSNFGVWLSGIGTYPMTPAGLLECYLAGIPYLRFTLAGDAFYGVLLFAAALAASRYQRARVASPIDP